MRVRIAPQAETDLDSIWDFVATESASIEIADRIVASLTSRFLLLGTYPYLGRNRDHDFGMALRSFTVAEYVIVYAVEPDSVHILRIVHGRRDLNSIFSL